MLPGAEPCLRSHGEEAGGQAALPRPPATPVPTEPCALLLSAPLHPPNSSPHCPAASPQCIPPPPPPRCRCIRC